MNHMSMLIYRSDYYSFIEYYINILMRLIQILQFNNNMPILYNYKFSQCTAQSRISVNFPTVIAYLKYNSNIKKKTFTSC